MARRSPVSTGGIIGRSKDETDVNQFVGECLDLKNLPEGERSLSYLLHPSPGKNVFGETKR